MSHVICQHCDSGTDLGADEIGETQVHVVEAGLYLSEWQITH